MGGAGALPSPSIAGQLRSSAARLLGEPTIQRSQEIERRSSCAAYRSLCACYADISAARSNWLVLAVCSGGRVLERRCWASISRGTLSRPGRSAGRPLSLSRRLRAPARPEDRVRSGQLLSPQPEHRANHVGQITFAARGRATCAYDPRYRAGDGLATVGLRGSTTVQPIGVAPSAAASCSRWAAGARSASTTADGPSIAAPSGTPPRDSRQACGSGQNRTARC